MKLITINLLGTSAIRKKRKRIKFSVTILYAFAWIFYLFTLYYVYKTNLFISSIYQKDIRKISAEIISQGPKLDRIQILYDKKKDVISKNNIYLQKHHRSINWLHKMIALSNSIPENTRLKELVVNTDPGKGKEKMKLIGYMLIDRENQDVTQLNTFKRSLEKQEAFINDFDRVDIIQSRIGITNSNPIMSFIIAAY
ncbi:MAG: hypothetical protein H8D45_25205 [Bacteroidetes bacterium]|nr:hypothetical protein [Bacteroidota bacterium]MBL7067215.1 hypothetical protein [Candidatus Neomarinimicrobiota bacterium]